MRGIQPVDLSKYRVKIEDKFVTCIVNLDLHKDILSRQEELSKILVNMSKILTTDKNASKNADLKQLNKQYKTKISEIDKLVKERDKQNGKRF